MKIKIYDERKQQFSISYSKTNIEKIVKDLWQRHYTLEKIAIDINYSTDFVETGIIEAWIYDGKDYELKREIDDFGAFVVYQNRAKCFDYLIDSIYSTIKGLALVLVNT